MIRKSAVGVSLRLCSLSALALIAACDSGQSGNSRQAGAQLSQSDGDLSVTCATRPDATMLASEFPTTPSAHIIVAIDQTTEIPADVKSWVIDQVAKARPGARVEIVTFSSYTQNAHPTVKLNLSFDFAYPPNKVDDAPSGPLARYKVCVTDRSGKVILALKSAIDDAIQGFDPKANNSDIVSAIHEFSEKFDASDKGEKVLIVISDMLENSSILNFYSHGKMLPFDVKHALSITTPAKLDGVKVVVAGAGLLPSGKSGYRSQSDLDRIDQYWSAFFEGSGASSVEIGHPVPMKDLPLG